MDHSRTPFSEIDRDTLDHSESDFQDRDEAGAVREIKVRTWGAFLRRLSAIQKQPGADLLFRGHGDSRWSLQTTLERRNGVNMPVARFFRLAGKIRPVIESFTERTFEVPTYPELEKLLGEYDGFSLALSFGRFPMYSFLIYTRHHGFPSPLLDWTRSPYIAAFFAFADENPRAKGRTIFVWSQSRITSSGTDQPQLKTCGPYVTAHRRHVLQQCEYTVCATYVTKDSEWRFTPQEEALVRDGHRLWKFTLPSSERPKVLKYLDAFNLNAYSLYGSEDSLMHTLATREFDLPDFDVPAAKLRQQPSYFPAQKSYRKSLTVQDSLWRRLHGRPFPRASTPNRAGPVFA